MGNLEEVESFVLRKLTPAAALGKDICHMQIDVFLEDVYGAV